MDAVKDRILGMLYGCAIGDAFAMPSEMWAPGHIRESIGYITDFMQSPAENEISGGFKAGETTDDTIVAFISAEALIAKKGKVLPIDIVNSIEQWSLKNPKSKTIVGPSTRKAFEAIHAGLAVEEAGKNGITNGAATRSAPAGVLVSSSSYSALADLVVDICMATHNTSAAISGACAITAAVAHGIEGSALCSVLHCAVAAAEEGGKRGYGDTPTDMVLRIKDSFARSDEEDSDIAFMQRQYEENGSGLPMQEAAPSALAVAYRSEGDILRAARLAANMGGDTDTVAAMACMVVGAHIGASAIPGDVKKLVSDVNGHPFEEVAEGLYRLRLSLTGGKL